MTDLFPEVLPRNGADENTRFTLRPLLEYARAVANVSGFDLDAAACEESHVAAAWYGPDHHERRNGLVEPWFSRTFVNPPWSDIEPWVKKAWREWTSDAERARVQAGLQCLERVVMVLPGDRQHMGWWQNYVEPFRDGRDPGIGRPKLTTHYPPKPRPAYGHPGNPRGVGCAEPNFTTVVLVWR